MGRDCRDGDRSSTESRPTVHGANARWKSRGRSSHEPYAQLVGNERNDRKGFMGREQVRKEHGAFHEPPLSRPAATLSPPCGERAGRGVPSWFMVPMHAEKRKGALHEPSPRSGVSAERRNSLGTTASGALPRRRYVTFKFWCILRLFLVILVLCKPA